MIHLSLMIEQFGQKGEKTGWTYLFISATTAQQLKADCKVSFRVKGKVDEVEFNGIALHPMGEGDFIMPLKKDLQKKIAKRRGALVSLIIEEDKDFKFEMPEDLQQCFNDLKGTLEQFCKMPKSHQNYYIRWINEAKTMPTRIKRLTQTVEAMDKKMNFGEMIRFNKNKK